MGRSRREFLVGGACALVAPVVRGMAPAEMVVRVTDAQVGALPEFGLGFSSEKNNIGLQDWFVARNTTFAGCCKRLGPGVIRIGGSHVDHNKWDPGGAGGDAGKTSPKDIAVFAEFVKSVGYKVVYGVNFATSTPKDAAAEAVVAAKALGENLLAFEIGNEPNIFTNHGLRPKGWGYSSFLKEWEPFADAVHKAVPGAALSGPGSYGGWDKWIWPFAKDERKRIQLLTGHFYTQSGKEPGATLEELFGKMPELFSDLATSVKAAKDNGIPMGFRMVETNSFVGGGLDGVSDRAAAALWALEYILTAGLVGVNGLCFQIGQAEHSNTPLAMDVKGARVTDVRPEFYALALAAALGAGPMLRCDVQGKPAAAAVFAVKAGGKTSVVMVNKSETAVSARVAAVGGAVTANVVRMTSGGLLKADVRLNGTEIAVDGSSEVKPVALAASGGTFEVEVPGAGAVWIEQG